MMKIQYKMNDAGELVNTVVFMNQGQVWETGQSEQVFSNPQTEELQGFLTAVR